MDIARRQTDPRVDVRLLSLALLAGSLTSLLQPELVPLSWWWLLPLLLAFLLSKPWRMYALALLVGASWSSHQAERVLADRWPPSRHGEEHAVTAVVIGFPERHEDVVQLLLGSQQPGVPQRVRANWYRAPEHAARIKAGSCWHWQLRLRSPSGLRNPGGFDFEAWMFRERIGATATILSARPCERQPLTGWLDRWRARMAESLQAGLPGRAGSGVLLALLLGDRSGISSEQWEVFRRTGTSHLMAISGLHVGVVAGMVWWLMIVLWRCSAKLSRRVAAPRAALIASVLAALGYCALAGFSLPTLRALCMLAALGLALASGRRAASTAVLAVALIAVLAVDAFAPLRPGFWLSFAAVAVILWVLNGRQHGWLSGLLRIQLALSLMLAPLSMSFFGGISLSGLLVNLFAVPAMSLLLPALLLGGLLGMLWPPALGLPLHGLEWALIGLQQVSAWPLSWLSASPDIWETALILIGVTALVLWRLRVWPLGLLCLLAAVVPPVAPPPGSAHISFLDVGQGTAVLVRTHRHALLYDAGPAWGSGFDAGRMIVEPAMRHAGLRGLDRAVISHSDRDHAGGLRHLRAAGLLPTDRESPIGCLAGESWQWDQVRFLTLHPTRSGQTGNNSSCVLRIEGDGWSALLPGDIEADAERQLLASGVHLQADILLAPHHGSRSSSSAGFVAAVAPQVVVHSAGWRHRFGHPHAQVVARYRAVGARQFQTGAVGALQVVAGPQGIETFSYRDQACCLWQRPSN